SAHQALRGAAQKPTKGSSQPAPTTAAAAEKPGDKKFGLTYGESIELGGIMETIAACEAEVAAAEAEMAAPDLYSQRGEEVPALQKRLTVAQSKLASTVDRWEYLESKKASDD